MKALQIRMLKVIIGISVVLGVVFFVIVPRISAAREAARRSHCLSCMRSLGKACVMYAMDHDGTFPSKWSDLRDEYVSNRYIFNCKSSPQSPGSIETVDQWAEFVIVPGLTTNHPGETVLAYEPVSNHRGYGGHVVFCDTSFRWLEADDHQKILNTVIEEHQHPAAR